MDTSITRAIPNDAPGWHNTNRDNEKKKKKKKKKKKEEERKGWGTFFLNSVADGSANELLYVPKKYLIFSEHKSV